MEFVRYAERGADLINASFETTEDVCDFLAARVWLRPSVVDKDAPALRRFARELRPLFALAIENDERQVVDHLNALLGKHPITPYVAGHDSQSWHLHVSNRAASVADLLIAEALLGLAILVCDLGPLRLGVCSANSCTDVFVDTSPNRSRRYCSDRCSSRANVAAYRARRKAEATS